jgi:hypothetical protein
MKAVTMAAAVAILAMMWLGGCKSDSEGVKSSYRSQWVQVSAGTEATTKAAEAVLKDNKLTDVKSKSTGLDGEASGNMADGTKVNVSVKAKGAGSEVTVVVGRLGDPAIGDRIAAEIKSKAESR